jgi:hypothetical protein
MLIDGVWEVTLRFTNDILGSAPANKQFYEKFLLSKLIKRIDQVKNKIAKAKNEEEKAILQDLLDQLESEMAELPLIEDDSDMRLTIFYRAPYKDDITVPVIRAHQVLGFLKYAFSSFKDQLGVKNPRDKVDRYIRVQPLNIFIYDTKIGDEYIVDAPDDILERPIRATTPYGERVSVVKSEVIKSSDHSKLIRFKLILLKNKHIDFEKIKSIFEYGQYNGISQWRSAGYGTFKVEKITPVKLE